MTSESIDSAGRAARPWRPGRRIRVLQFAYGHALYGAERWVLTLIRHLDRERVETVVASLLDAGSPDLPLIDGCKELGLETLAIDARRNLVASSLRGLRTAIRRLGIDVLHTHGHRQDLLGSLAVSGLSCRTLSTPHGWDAKPPLKERFYMALNKLMFLRFDAVAPLSRELLESLAAVPLLKSKLHLIENGVDLSEVDAAVPAALPWDNDAQPPFTIGYIGRLMPGKGVEVLLEALAQVGGLRWRCLLLGEGPETGRLQELADRLGLAERVQFLGYRPDRLSFLKRLDLFVLPSYREGTPRCLMEALAAGVPCAGSSIPGIQVLIEDGITGYAFPPGEAPRLARTIVAVHADREGSLARAQAGRALVRARFSAKAMAARYEDLYAELMSR